MGKAETRILAPATLQTHEVILKDLSWHANQGGIMYTSQTPSSFVLYLIIMRPTFSCKWSLIQVMPLPLPFQQLDKYLITSSSYNIGMLAFRGQVTACIKQTKYLVGTDALDSSARLFICPKLTSHYDLIAVTIVSLMGGAAAKSEREICRICTTELEFWPKLWCLD